jgi:HAE1 family hydrophobic/amphiphilic exporter-1
MLGQWTGFNANSVRSLGVSRLFIALLVTYLLMAALFESFLYPLVIMFSVPLAAVGGFLGLAAVRYANPTQQLDTLTMLGFIILIGVVVNNAILIVHQALNFMRGLGEGEGDTTGKLPPREALRASVRSRIRPIFMTTATSVAGMLPLVLMPGSGSELYRGLGSVVVGGLVVSTLFTLVVVPLLFSITMDLKLGFYRLVYGEQAETTIA